MKQIILILVLVLMLSGCLNPYQNEINEKQLKINAYLIDNNNIDKLNDCTQLDSCDAYKCLCDTMASENTYCERYEDYCVNNVCEDITTNFNGITFMDDSLRTEKYGACIFMYDNVVRITGIEIKNIDNGSLTCVSKFRNNMDVPDWHVYNFMYRDGRFYDDEGMIIKCDNYE